MEICVGEHVRQPSSGVREGQRSLQAARKGRKKHWESVILTDIGGGKKRNPGFILCYAIAL